MSRRPLALFFMLTLAVLPASGQDPLLSGRPVKAWLTDLDAADVLICEEAIEILTRAGTASRAAVPKLRALAKHPNPSVRTRAALALWQIDGDVRTATRTLEEALRQAGLTSRRDAIQILTEMGEQAAPAAGIVLGLVEDGDRTVRTQASTALARMGRAALPALVDALASKEATHRRHAAQLLLTALPLTSDQTQRKALVARLTDDDLHVRVAAARLLWLGRQTDPAVVRTLQAGIKADDPSLRDAVLSALRDAPGSNPLAVPILEAGLADREDGLRLRAARLLYAVEKKADRVLPIYQEVLRREARSHWNAALAGLGELGPAARPALPRLVEMLRIKEFDPSEVRAALQRIGPAVIPTLVKLLDAPTEGTTRMSVPDLAVDVLGGLGRSAVPAVLPLLESKDRILRLRVLRILSAAGSEAKESVKKVEALLDDREEEIRSLALLTLGAIGPQARAAAPTLLRKAETDQRTLRAAYLRALATIGPEVKAGTAAALAALAARDPQEQCAGLELLWRVAPRHRALLPHARVMLRGPATCSTAIQVLTWLGPAAAPAVPTLIEVVRHRPGHATEAEWALAAIGPPARAAVPVLLTKLRQEESWVTYAAIRALEKIGAEARQVVPALAEFTRTSESHALTEALHLLGTYGKEAQAAAPDVWAVLRNPNRTVHARSAAGLAIGRIDPERARKDALPVVRSLLSAQPTHLPLARAVLLLAPGDETARAALERALEDSHGHTRAMALIEIGLLQTAGKSFLPVVQRHLTDPAAFVRVSAAVALWRIAQDARAAVPVLRALLSDSEPFVRERAASALGDLRAEARTALPALLAARDDREVAVRLAVERAVRQIDPAVAERSGIP